MIVEDRCQTKPRWQRHQRDHSAFSRKSFGISGFGEMRPCALDPTVLLPAPEFAMTAASRADPRGRFAGLAGLYARHRPGYPPAALDLIAERCKLDSAALLVDVGCGTGIATRLFAARGVRVIGIEPDDDMRAQAQAALTEEDPASGASGSRSPEYRKGTAEATGLPDAVATAVLVAQAFHWFDAPAALGEFHRILRPLGSVALLWNERDQADPCTA